MGIQVFLMKWVPMYPLSSPRVSSVWRHSLL